VDKQQKSNKMNPERIELMACEIRDALKKVGKKYKLETYQLLILSKQVIDGTIRAQSGAEHLEELNETAKGYLDD